MYSFFKNFHSGFRFIVLIFVIIALLQSFAGWLGKKPYSESNRKFNLVAMIMVHTQILFGLVLYFISPIVQFNSIAMKIPIMRYFTAEHITMMLIAMIVITIGHSRSKKAVLAENKHKAIAISYTIGIVIICAALMMGHIKVFGMNG